MTEMPPFIRCLMSTTFPYSYCLIYICVSLCERLDWKRYRDQGTKVLTLEQMGWLENTSLIPFSYLLFSCERGVYGLQMEGLSLLGGGLVVGAGENKIKFKYEM